MFRKMVEDALGELLQEMSPSRPQIDPVDQRRRPDMTREPDSEGRRVAVGETGTAPRSGMNAPLPGEGRRAPREMPYPEGRTANVGTPIREGRRAPRETPYPEGDRFANERANIRTAIEEAPAMLIQRRAAPAIRAQLTNPSSIRDAFQIMEILGPPLSLRDQPGADRR